MAAVPCWVLVKKYSDGSGFYVMRVYTNRERADFDLQLVKNDDVMVWSIYETTIVDGGL